jgi:urease accessory protein
VTVHVRRLLGSVDEPTFEGRRRVPVPVAWDEASRRRLRRDADDGTDVAIDLDDGAYLFDGAVLNDDGAQVLVASRPPERAFVVMFDQSLAPEELVSQAVLIGWAFGNQHAPLDIDGAEIRIPLITSEATARRTVEALGLRGVTVSVAAVPLGRLRPLSIERSHGHGHE